jgi:hypothetical protein
MNGSKLKKKKLPVDVTAKPWEKYRAMKDISYKERGHR